MNRTIEVLETRGLISEEQVRKVVFESPIEAVRSIREELEASVENDPNSLNDSTPFTPFNFLASASLRGDSGCSSISCHLRKTTVLARYAALFCDRLLLPLRISSSPHGSSEYDERYALVRGTLSLLEFRPLIEHGIVALLPPVFHYCPKCFKDLVPRGDQILEVKEELLEENVGNFSVGYDPEPTKRAPYGRLIVEGPPDYVEHGHMSYRLSKKPVWLTDDTPVSKLPIALLRRTKILDSIFGQMARDIAVHHVFGLRFKAQYLTDKAGEAEFLVRMSEEDELAARKAMLCAQLSHTVPLFTEVPLQRVMKIREQDYDAFLSYRSALGAILADHVAKGTEFSNKKARQLYSDLLEPEVLRLRQQATAERKRMLKKSATKMGITLGLVAFGIYSGLLPAQLADLCKAFGGLKVLGDMGETLAAIESNPPSVRSHNLYFLLRLTQEAEYSAVDT